MVEFSNSALDRPSEMLLYSLAGRLTPEEQRRKDSLKTVCSILDQIEGNCTPDKDTDKYLRELEIVANFLSFYIKGNEATKKSLQKKYPLLARMSEKDLENLRSEIEAKIEAEIKVRGIIRDTVVGAALGLVPGGKERVAATVLWSLFGGRE